jgi:hypothetical protein
MAHLTPEEFGAVFDSLFQRSAFRLELLDQYVAANEAEPFRRFLAGEPQDPAWRGPWQEFVRSSLSDGKQMARVHVVDEPLSDYLQFELTCAYPANVDAGEDVRILPPYRHPAVSLPSRDYWLFDDRAVVLMDYDEDGDFTGAELASDSHTIRHYRRIRDLAMRHSVPLADYLTSLGMKEAV